MQNPNNIPNGFNNMNTPQQPWGQPPHFHGIPPQAPWNQPTLGQIHQQPNDGPWSNPFNFNGVREKLKEAKEFAEQNASNFGSIPGYEGLQKEIRRVKLKALESQIRYAIFPHTLGNFTPVNPPQILSLNGYRIEGMGEKLKNFDEEVKVEVVNSLGNFYNIIKVSNENLTNVRDVLKNIIEEFDNNIGNQTNMLKSLDVEIEVIKSNNGGESEVSDKKEALKSLEELSASLRDLGLTDEEVEAKLEAIQKALK